MTSFAYLGLDCDVVIEDVRLVDRADWLRERQKGIGGSDAAATMSLSPWKSPFALYVDKVDDIIDEQTERMLRGQQMEGAIATMFAAETGAEVLRYQPMVRSRRHPFMLFNPDRLVVTTDGELELVEAKNVDARKAYEWAEGPPLHYRIQVLHGLDVLQLTVGHLCALIGGNTFVHYRIEWDEQVLAGIIRAEEKFWGEVEMKRPPEVDESEATREALAKHYARPILETVEVPPRMLELIEQRASAKETLKLAEARVVAVENEMKSLIGDAQAATVDGSVVVTWKLIHKDSYTVREQNYRQIGVPKGKKT